MTTNPDFDQAREWAAEITESRQTNIRPDAFTAAEVIASLPDAWIDADKLREALDWRDSRPSGDDYDGEFYDRLRALLPPAPLPDPLFCAKATHPEHGEGVVTSHFPVVDGTVRFMFPDEASNDGTAFQWVEPSTLTFHTPEMSKNGAEIDTSTEHVDPIDTTPDHPVFLETEEDYENAPENTVVALDEHYPIVKIVNLWTDINGRIHVPKDLVSSARSPIHVLRWGDSK